MTRFLGLTMGFVLVACGGDDSGGDTGKQQSAVAPECTGVPLPNGSESLEGSTVGKAGSIDTCDGTFTQGDDTWSFTCEAGSCTCFYNGDEVCQCKLRESCSEMCCPGASTN